MDASKEISYGGHKISKKISEGFTSHVYKITDNDNGESHALKKFKASCKTIQRLKEIAIQSALSHDNIIKIKNYDKINCDWMVLELHGSCDLYDMITKLKTPLSEQTSKYFFKQIIEAVSYMHKEGVYHRDIKLDNFLYCEDTLQIKLCDFGFSVNKSDGLVTKCVGTRGYIAPELQIDDSLNMTVDAVILAPADVFALGSLLFILVLGDLAFIDSQRAKCSNWKLIQDKKWTQFWKQSTKFNKINLSIEFKKLLESVFTQTQEVRISLDEFLTCSWMTGDCSTREEVLSELKIKLPK